MKMILTSGALTSVFVFLRTHGKMNKIITSTQYLSPLLIISTHQLSAYYIPYLTSIRKKYVAPMIKIPEKYVCVFP